MTLAIFAYNQEDMVGDAIKSAFSQKYSPLEIILSDDCSSDTTFEVMQNLATSYSGPHRVVINRNKTNQGLAKHIHTVVKRCTGDWLIAHAGDDISHADRVTDIADVAKKGYKAFVSDIAREPSQLGSLGCKSRDHFDLYDACRNFVDMGIGAAYAYSLDAIRACLPYDSRIMGEDRILPLQAAVYGKVFVSPRKLVLKRPHENSLTQLGKKADLDSQILQSELFFKTHVAIVKRAFRDGLISQNELNRCIQLLTRGHHLQKLSLRKRVKPLRVSEFIDFWRLSLQVHGVATLARRCLSNITRRCKGQLTLSRPPS